MDWQAAVALGRAYSATHFSPDEFVELLVALGAGQRPRHATSELLAMAVNATRQVARDRLQEFAYAATGALLADRRHHRRAPQPTLVMTPVEWINDDARGSVDDTQHALVELVASAEREIVLLAPFTVPESIAGVVAPLQFARRGTELNLLVTGSDATITWICKQLQALLPAAVAARTTVHLPRSSEAVWPHAKILLVDGERGYAGSANFTPGGLQHYFELGVVLTSEQAQVVQKHVIPHLMREIFTSSRLLVGPP